VQLSIAISPCPNDTFIFDAIINQLIDTSPYEFGVHFGDVEKLNQKAFKSEYDITKLSYHAYTNCSSQYDLFTSGSALGNNCGPLFISRQEFAKDKINELRIGIPGEWTTANFLLKYFAPDAKNINTYLFSDIERGINAGDIDAGVIIHENRFTYKQRGFHLIQDLGQYWENKTNHPIPLGGIVIKKSLSPIIKQDINQLIRQSIEYAWKKDSLISGFIAQNATEMDPKIMEEHIRLYVNDFSLNLGYDGLKAVQHLFHTLNKPLPQIIL